VKNRPWQFDFHAVLLEKYDGKVRPSDLVFDKLAVWVRVFDLPLDMMNISYGKIIGNWIGHYIAVDVDEDGFAWGKELRIRVEINVNKPLIRGVNLKESDDDIEGRWFDLKYERIPHFCFDCGFLWHQSGNCEAEKGEVQQWGEWLRASPGRSRKPPPPHRPSVSTSSFSNRSGGADSSSRSERVFIRDVPTKRSLFKDGDQADSGSSRTGGGGNQYREKAASSPPRHHGMPREESSRNAQQNVQHSRRPRAGTYVHKERKNAGSMEPECVPPRSPRSKKRRTRQVWLPVGVTPVGTAAETGSGGKKQRVASVFDRISEPNSASASPARQDHRGQ
jgi:hypothetical protein